jgi:phosphomannomutase
VIGREATLETIQRLARAAARGYREGAFGPGDRSRIAVGFDTRLLSEEFAAAAAEVFREAGLDVLLAREALPTPAVSLAVRDNGLSGGIAITASHNPPSYNGFKLKAHFGGSAPPEIYARVEREVDSPLRPSSRPGRIETADLLSPYRDALSNLVDRAAVAGAKLQILADAMHGAADSLLEQILGPGATRIESFRADRDVNFGGTDPEPIERNLQAAARRLREGRFDFGVAMDGDGDRLGVLDAEGHFVSPHRVLALLALHAFRHRQARGGIARSFSTSLLIDRIGSRLGVPVFETAIGFKHIADLMISGKAAVGGEESGGYGFAFHLPERDGTLSALLLAEHLTLTRRTLAEALDALDREFGHFDYARRDIRLPVETIREFLRSVERRPPKSVAGYAVSGAAHTDGIKLLFSGRGWLLMRLSGTEPLIRLYCEHEETGAPSAILARAEARLGELGAERQS